MKFLSIFITKASHRLLSEVFRLWATRDRKFCTKRAKKDPAKRNKEKTNRQSITNFKRIPNN